MSDISVRNLSFGYDENLVFDGINLEYDCKDFLAIIGPNGGGKSTLLKLMLGLNKPSGGTIEVFGQEPASVSKAVGYVPQNIPINQSFPMRVLEVVLMGRIDKKLFGFYGKDDKIEAEAALERVLDALVPPAKGATSWHDGANVPEDNPARKTYRERILREELNAALKAIKENGAYKKVNDKYFKYDISGGTAK